MDVQLAMDLGREALWVMLVVSAPVMAVGMLVGVAVALVQAITQLQEQTLSFVPKIIAMALCAMVLVPWIAGQLVEYANAMLGEIPF